MAWNNPDLDAGDYIDSGVVPVSGTSARSIAVAFRTTATVASQAWLGGWGTDSTGAAFRWRLDHTASTVFRLEVQQGYMRGSTTGLDDQSWHRVVVGYGASGAVQSPSVFYIDGSSETVGASSNRNINTGTGANLHIGIDGTKPSEDATPADHAEVAVFNRALTAAEAAAITSGVSPLFFRPILYMPFLGSIDDWIGLASPSETGSGTFVDSPYTIYPSSAHIVAEPAAAAPGGSIPLFMHHYLQMRGA